MDPFYPLVAGVFRIFEVPKLRLNFNLSVGNVSKWTIFIFVIVSYFMFMSGIVYDAINEPPAIGSERDERGKLKPVAIMAYRLNGQYIIEGFTAGFLFTLGGLGFILMSLAAENGYQDWNRYLMLGVGVGSVVISYSVLVMFIRIKVPGYLGR
jgi:hypothetical protein